MGKFIESTKYSFLTMSCMGPLLSFSDEEYTTINLTMYTKKLFQNYHTKNLNFTKHYIAKNSSAVEYLEKFKYGSFQYFETFDGDIYACGIMK